MQLCPYCLVDFSVPVLRNLRVTAHAVIILPHLVVSLSFEVLYNELI
jgi:hypothetical protein